MHCCHKFNLSQLFRVFSCRQALWMWSFSSWSCLHMCLRQGLDIPLCIPHGQEDGLSFAVIEHKRAIKTPVRPPLLPRLGRHMVLNPSWAEAITRCFSVSVNSQGQHVYLAVLLGVLLLSWLKKQVTCPVIRNISVVNSWAAPDHGTYIWPCEREMAVHGVKLKVILCFPVGLL